MIAIDSVYKIGKLGKPHGVKGELSFFFDDDIFDRADADYLILLIDDILVPFFIEEYTFHTDNKAFIKFDSVDSIEQASQLVNAEVFFPKDIAAPQEDRLPLAQLAGFTIYDETSATLTAPVSRIDITTDNPLFELEDGILIPIAEEWIKNIDREKKLIRMTLPEGLLSL